jgi:hypothetical protein
MSFSLRSQIALVWWSIAFAIIFGLAIGLLLHMVPPPDARMGGEQLKAWYESRATEIKIGATISSYTSAFLVSFFIVIGAQMRRLEQGFPVWTWATIIGGSLASIFLVLPPMLFGTAAFTPGRDADATAVLHEFALLMLVTTDQFFIFPWVALVVISLRPTTVAHSAFPRWYGYWCIWLIGMFELGALAFNWKSGPFSWRGLFVFYSPFTLFTVWIIMTATLLLRSIKAQLADLPPAEVVAPAEAVAV